MAFASHVTLSLALAAGLASLSAGAEVRTASSNNSASSSGQLSGPVMGFLVDSTSQTLRAIRGVPGASILGPRQSLAASIGKSAVSPRQDYVLLLSGDQHQAAILDLRSGAAEPQIIAGARAGADLIGMSPRGQAAALFFETEGKLQILTGLPDSPKVAREFSLAGVAGPAAALAVSDDGAVAVLAAGQGEANALFVVDSKGAPRLLAGAAGQISSVTFRPNTHDVFAADRKNNQILWLHDVGGAANVTPLAGISEGVAEPVGVQASSDGFRAIVANHKTGTIVSYDLKGGPTHSATCSCQPTTLDRLSGNAVFRLTEDTGGPLYVYDGDSAQPRVVFVPPDRGSVRDRVNTPIREPGVGGPSR